MKSHTHKVAWQVPRGEDVPPALMSADLSCVDDGCPLAKLVDAMSRQRAKLVEQREKWRVKGGIKGKTLVEIHQKGIDAIDALFTEAGI